MNLKRTPLIVVAGCAMWLTGCGMAKSQGNDPKKPGSPASSAQAAGAAAVSASPLQLNVDRVMVGHEFLVYVGGGAKLVPPTARGNAESLPSISIFDGSTFLAGKIQSQDEKAAMIKDYVHGYKSGAGGRIVQDRGCGPDRRLEAVG